MPTAWPAMRSESSRSRTRAEPQAYCRRPHLSTFIRLASPANARSRRSSGLLAAYYKNALGGDWSRASPPRVEPGDTILVHAGVYKDFDRLNYSHEIQSRLHDLLRHAVGRHVFLERSGTADKPIAIKAAGDGEVIFDGDGNTVLFNVMAADHLYFEGITFRNTLLAIEAGQKGIAGRQDLTVKHSRFEDVGVAIHSDWSGSKNFYIADNVMTGATIRTRSRVGSTCGRGPSYPASPRSAG